MSFPKLTRRKLMALAGAGLIGGGLWQGQSYRNRQAALAHLDDPLPAPDGPLHTFHLGHSLVGREMPAMLAQLAGEGHSYHSQLGWGTPLRSHWEPDVPINGFDHENAHPLYRDARKAIGSGDYDAVVLTEMVELRDSIKFHDSPTYLANWAKLARAKNPNARVYMYETWHHLDDGNGWLWRVDNDLGDLWERRVVLPAINRIDAPIHIMPAGQVMAAVIRKVEAAGGIGKLEKRTSLFPLQPNGVQDTIHLNDMGLYLVALVHYATLYHRSPVGLPHALKRADGTMADAPDAVSARMMQETVWEVVSRYPKSGVRA